jgi:mycothiol maleylpyruvate isomerase-like protein
VITGVNAPARTTRARTAANRRLLADFFDGLDEDQLRERSLCDAWTVREILGHLVMPLTGSVGAFLRQVVQARGSLDRASVAVASEIARRPGR